MKKNNIVVMDFSGIYSCNSIWAERICKMKTSLLNIDYSWLDFKSLSGCNCYCDDDAKGLIQEKIKAFSVEGIHFIDSGNYHYISKFWLEKIEKPFRLLVFDNHTDMQPPAFGGLLSCGGWIAASIEELQNLKEVILIGPDEDAYSQVDEDIKKCTRFLSREELRMPNKKDVFLKDFPADLPLYISIDKDILCKDDAETTWSQGDMKIQELCESLKHILSIMHSAGQEIIGIDICGECDADQQNGMEKNEKTNDILLDFLLTK